MKYGVYGDPIINIPKASFYLLKGEEKSRPDFGKGLVLRVLLV